MAGFFHQGDRQTVIHYHNAYDDRDPFFSHHHCGPPAPSLSTTRPKHAPIIEPSKQRTPTAKSLLYKVSIYSPNPYGDGIYPWADSNMPSWFKDRTLRYKAGPAAAAHESMLHDLRIKELQMNREHAFRKLQSAHERWERYDDQWRDAVREDRDWEVGGKYEWARGAREDNEGIGGIRAERRRGELTMVKRKKDTGKDRGRGRVGGRFGFI